jgi:hypothetical protein
MTGSAKQSSRPQRKYGLLPPSLAELRRTSRRFAPRNDDVESTAPSAGTSPRVAATFTTFRISDAHPRSRGTRARVLQIDPPQIEGAGKTGCTPHPRSRVQTAHKNAHEHTGSAEAIRPSLRNGFTAYAVLSPATNSSCHRRRRINGSSKPGRASQNLRQLDTSNGCQDHTVLPYAYRRSSARCRSLTSRLRLALRSHRAPGAAASTASQPNVRDDHDTPLFSGRDGASL